jgi:hypothetical protein
MSTESKITEVMEALHSEGVDMRELGGIEARLVTLLYRARRLHKADNLLVSIGPDKAAEQLNCCRATVYNLAKRARKSKHRSPA